MRSLCKIFGCSVMPSASSLDCSAVLKSGRQKRVKIGFMVASLCLSLFSLFFSPSSASALDIGYVDVGAYSITNFIIRKSDGTSVTCSNAQGGSKYCTGVTGTISGFDINVSGQIPANSITTLNITVGGANVYNTGFYGFNAQAGWVVVDQEVYHNAYGTWQTISTQLQIFRGDKGQSSQINLTLYGNGRALTLDQASEIWVQPISWGSVIDGSWFVDSIVDVRNKLGTTTTLLQAIKDNGITATVDQSGVISAVNQGAQQQVAATNANTQAVNNAASQAHSDAQAQTDATNAQTEQQKNQYEQDKQEEANREEQGNDDAVKASGIFNFELVNPFESIFSLFLSPSTCANIPVLASWVHSDTSTVCSWWPQNVRNVLTPVFGIASMMLLFGFLMRWLGGSETIHFGGD